MTTLNDNRLVKTFAELTSGGRKTMVPFISAGYPDLETTEALLTDFQRRGVRVCELGIPFSDPIADGPIIQGSYTQALAGGVDSDKIFTVVRRWRAAGGRMALVAMVSYSIVFRHGSDKYLTDAADAGFDGVLIPDLPLEEARGGESQALAHGLANVMLIAPTTSPQRRLEIARHSRGFIYFISVSGITGERTELPPQTIAAVGELRKHTNTPICVGFGISSPEMVAAVCQAADGAIVGSAIVHRIGDAKDRSRDKLVEGIGGFVGELLAPLG